MALKQQESAFFKAYQEANLLRKQQMEIVSSYLPESRGSKTLQTTCINTPEQLLTGPKETVAKERGKTRKIRFSGKMVCRMDNSFNMTRLDIDLYPMRLFIFLISNISKFDTANTTFYVPVSDLYSALRVSHQTALFKWRRVFNAILGLQSLTSLIFPRGKNVPIEVSSFIPSVEYVGWDGSKMDFTPTGIGLKLHDEIWDFFAHREGRQYTSIEHENKKDLDIPYAFRIYDFCLSANHAPYRKKWATTLPVDELKLRFNKQDMPNFTFLREVINRSCKQITERTNISVVPQPLKEGKWTVSIVFICELQKRPMRESGQDKPVDSKPMGSNQKVDYLKIKAENLDRFNDIFNDLFAENASNPVFTGNTEALCTFVEGAALERLMAEIGVTSESD